MNTDYPHTASRTRRTPGLPFHSSTLALAMLTVLPQAHAAGSLMDALTYGTVSGQLRYRYEGVDQEGFTDDATASTLRTQLGYTTDSYKGFNAMLQFENVAEIGSDDYNNTNNGHTQYPVVADPAGTEVNQVWLGYEAGYNTALKYGRQAINLDNQRFIGTVGWRQNEQTYDAFSLVNGSLPSTTVTAAYVTNVNRIFGEDHPVALFRNYAMNSGLFNASYKGFSAGSLTGYAYLLDFEDAPAISNETLGLRFDGKRNLGDNKLLYTAEYASQSDYQDGASTIDADYFFGGLGVEVQGWQVKANYEQLGGDGVYGFSTPLATLHAFNGWADKFLVTPADGIEDIFLTVGKTVYDVALAVQYHTFASDNLGYDYGTEWDLSAGKKINKSFSVLLKYATYSGDGNATVVARNLALSQDVDKLWLQADVTF
jgi:hypothetical protein